MAKKEEEKTPKSSYGAKDITVLEGLDPVRKRPGMYIGTTDVAGVHHLVWEVLDNGIDEAMAGYAKNITVEILADNRIAITDDGRGIPVEKHKQTKKSALETVLTVLHAGGKFGGDGYKVSGGLHGVGVSVVNALSQYLKAEVHRDGGMYVQEYKRGKPQGAVKKVAASKKTGTIITFEPDPEIFAVIEFNRKTIMERLRRQAFLTKGTRIEIIDYREPTVFYKAFYFDGGLLSFIRYLNADIETIQEEVFYVDKEVDGVAVEVAFMYNNDIEAQELGFANNIFTVDGGMHITGFRSALTRTLNDYARANGHIKESDENLSGDDIREGLVTVVSVKLRDPQFEGQTKGRLGSPEARTAVESVVNEALKNYVERNSKDAGRIVQKCLLAAKARKAAKAARDTVLRKGILEGLTLPGKLADCSSRSAEESELFIVEGDSAGGCFAGDTKVALTDGRNVSFKQLAREDKKGVRNYCYTIKEDGSVGVGDISSPRITKKSAKVVKVILDNDEEIICTPDHQFMRRDGSYVLAEDLNAKDSLMPLYRKLSDVGSGLVIDSLKMLVASNHKVKRIEMLSRTYDVYDIEVPGTHNFALASGVFVHNSAKAGRDRRTQAILPLRGKILNVEKARLDKMLANKEIKALVIALGTAIAESFDLEKLRYHKIIIMTDADVDGHHITTLLLTLFYRYFPQLISSGHVFVAQPPLYKVERGKTAKFAYSDEEKDALVKEMSVLKEVKKSDKEEEEAEGDEVEMNDQAEGVPIPEETGRVKGLKIQRYKGLGEMNADELAETTMEPDKRVLKQISVRDAQEADHLFDVLMGEAVAPRSKFIKSHARFVKDLDI
ncbi:MAG: DNA topoisomerase (ATP-hydrolyzing) subunit B [Candidatus Harrisonbacteria bacterium CG10_big_fil_rev_8_21_14_0_10_45_28]|uniref:DNA topoisomerase (ATP-hydrolyzing) n=1 Tax=Candidatus Harrisonbacteria bacterium CG10_big_fil_rev_8_21_14_0_10_45_28 TaxID=1974586 RepID=A0A2H0UME5_9BACT|nr:MAG: DNA topoisomerase (ATP-hydrolyzing) subunit B [Candidatus Harrisonbacteria bacterium CG10_big_fil_rev_8_21_14_0_10_45_28]